MIIKDEKVSAVAVDTISSRSHCQYKEVSFKNEFDLKSDGEAKCKCIHSHEGIGIGDSQANT